MGDAKSPLCLSDSVVQSRILAFAARLGIAPGLVVGRLQHDRLIPWRAHNALKREVDLTWALEAAEAVEGTWPDQTAAARAVARDFGLGEREARERVRRAAGSGRLGTNGKARYQMRFEPGALAAWRLAMRDRDLDAEEREEAA